MAGGRRTGRGGGKAGGKVNGTAGNSPLSSMEHSSEKSPLMSAQTSPQALPKTAVDVLGDVAKISLQDRLSALKDNGLMDNEEGNESQHQQPGPFVAELSDRQPAPVTEAAGCSKYVDEDECWDIDDDDDFDPAAADSVPTSVHTGGKEEVGATKRHLQKEVKIFRQRLSQNPNCKRTGRILLKKEELLDAYEKSHQENLQEWLGVKAELDGETTTGFLSGKVKVRKAKTEMSAVHFKGKTHSGAREVLVAATESFKDSFGGRGETGSNVTELRVMSRTLCDASRSALSAPWSEEEVRAAVRELAPEKSPEQDGLPKELFEHNWDLLGPVLMKFVGDFTRTAELPREISTAVTILLHKKGGKEELVNYRTITLLSTVYKVGFLPGRKLADAVAVVADAIEAGASGGKDWFFLMVDFQKAFDSISRPFLFRTLRGMGVPENFVSWAEGLHTGAGTRLHINGWTGDRVAVERGVRQGCPLAPYLFLCAVEPLCQEFAQRRLGIGDGGAERLAYLGYADDTSLLLHGEEQLAAAAEALENFGEASGLKVNKDKTVVFPLGKNRVKLPPAGLQYEWADENAPERLLGVWITANGDPLPSWEKS
ncbi:unnamed protein product [Closterium sp. Yama58-4]|nr:unnamed protein product [Closterium sp. Yama58-4]